MLFCTAAPAQSANLYIAGGGGYVGDGAGNGGDLSFNVAGTLDISSQDTFLGLVGTSAWNGATGVNLGTVSIGDGTTGRTFTLVGNGGFSVAGLRVTGKGNFLSNDTSSNFDLTGTALTFDLTNVSAGDILLIAPGTGTVDLSNTTVALRDNASTNVVPGEQVTLIDGNIAGTNLPSGNITTDYMGKTYAINTIAGAGGSLIATLTNPGVLHEHYKAYAEG